jgi:putative CocE/NonD family hydrolase
MRFSVETDVPVTMRDGTRLATNLWRPSTQAQVPALLVRSPYGKDDITQYGLTAPNIFALVEAGYAVAVQDCRGTFRSEGTFVPHADDADDGVDTIAWLVAQPWCDGAVGMYGRSYLGFVQWQVAATGVPGLKAIAPAATSADLYRAPWYSPGGALSLGTLLFWVSAVSVNGVRREIAAGRSDPAELIELAGTIGDLDRVAMRTLVSEQTTLAQHVPWLRQALAHPSRDAFWQELAATDRAAAIGAPAFNVGGWYDLFLGETLRAFTTMRRHGATGEARDGQRLVVGPWSHTNLTGAFPDRSFGPRSSVIAAELTADYLQFFDRWLRGHRTRQDGAPVRLFVMGIDRWRDEQDWPLPDTAYTPYYLGGRGCANSAGGDGVLATAPPPLNAQDTYLYDPRRPVPTVGGVLLRPIGFDGPADQRPVERRDDVLCYTTAVLEQAVEVTGPVTLTLFVSSSAVDTDFTGKLVDVHPDGRAILLTEGIRRMRYRESLTDPTPMRPGTRYEITIDLGATANVFLPGHRIRLEISSSNFPRYDRNGNSGGAVAEETEELMVAAVNRVHHGPGGLSRLVLPIVER